MITSRGVLVGAAAVLLILGGCAAQPTASPEPSETTPTSTAPQPDAVPATLVVSAAGVTVEAADGTQLDAATFTDPAEQIADTVSTALGEATVVDDDASCGEGFVYYTWGSGVTLTVRTAEKQDDLVTLSVKAATVGEVRVESEPGIAVGDDITELAASLPADQNDLAGSGALVWEATDHVGSSDGSTTPYGGVIYTDFEGHATAILAPGTIFSGYSC